DDKGNFKRKKSRSGAEAPLRYVDEKGRVMYEGELGRMDTFSAGLFVTNVLINVVFVATCFVSFWLLARFQWLHALGHAVVLALSMMLFVLPPVLGYGVIVAEKRAAPK